MTVIHEKTCDIVRYSDERYPCTCQHKQERSTLSLRTNEKYRANAQILLDSNIEQPGSANCDTVTCFGVDCEMCPLSRTVSNDSRRITYRTLGDLRGAMDRLKRGDGVAGSKTEGEPQASEGVGNPASDVRQPSHYKLFQDIESIEVIARSMTIEQFHGFCFGNILKYRLRAGKKSELATMEKDLAKASFYETLFEKHKGKCHA